VSGRPRRRPAGPAGRAAAPYALAVAIERAAQLDPVGDALTKAIRTALPAGAPKDLLSGTWLGHALHPILTDLPIGAWTSSLVLDWVGGARARPAADTLLAVGILTAVPASLTGAADWGDTQPKERRVGLAHAVANTLALALFSGSLVARRRGRRLRGRVLSLAGAGALGAGGYLGGHLVFARGLGVDRTAFESRPADWTDAAADADVLDGQPIGVRVDGVGIVITRHDGDLHALADRCTHRGAPLHQGLQRDGCIVCPWHQSIFRLADGAIVQGPATTPAPSYDVRVRDGRIEVRVPPEEVD
jgi:nitrite reductase/ring-hydroxylating ferredoxin subunit